MTIASERAILLALAMFAMAWVILRAHLQSITIDEAVSYTNFVSPAEPRFWQAHANNHLLHSILAWAFARVLRPSHLAVRSAAMVGAAVYIGASYVFSIVIAHRFLLRLFLFICLVFNPFILDFLVAARGYGLASGFLLSAVCLIAYALQADAESTRLVKLCMTASLCLALSFLSNFAFAFVAACGLLILYLLTSRGASARRRAILACTCFLPALALALVVSGPVVLHWPRSELNYGAASLAETVQSLSEASFYHVRSSVHEWLFIDALVPGILVPAAAVFAAWRVFLLILYFPMLRKTQSLCPAILLAVPLAAGAGALGAHWLVFRFTGIPLPKDRTGIYLVILATVFAGVLASIPIATRAGEITRRAITILIVIAGSYFVLCLRLHYFKEWRWDADTDKLYSVLAAYNHECGLTRIAANWRYDAALNFYRHASGRETFPEFPHSDTLPPGASAYVLYEPEDHDFLANNSLQIVYRTPYDTVVALNPAIADGERSCPITPPDHDR